MNKLRGLIRLVGVSGALCVTVACSDDKQGSSPSAGTGGSGTGGSGADAGGSGAGTGGSGQAGNEGAGGSQVASGGTSSTTDNTSDSGDSSSGSNSSTGGETSNETTSAGGSSSATTSSTGGETSSAGGAPGTTADETSSTTTGSGGAPDESCDDPDCEAAGVRCEGNALFECALDEEGCLVASDSDCGNASCDPLGQVPVCLPTSSQNADSCDEKLFVSVPASIAGEVFSDDFSDRHNFTDPSCAGATVAAPEAVFAVRVPAGETLSVSEVSHLTSESLSMDAVLGIMRGCGDSAQCLATGGLNERGGISYTAERDETVAVWVSGNSALDGSYDIRLEIPETIGNLAAEEDLPSITGGPLLDAEWDTYVLHTSARTVLSGDLVGDVNMLLFNELGTELLTSNTFTHFARFTEPGTYRIVVDALGDIAEYQFALSAQTPKDLGGYAIGDTDSHEFTTILEGERRYYAFELTEAASASITINGASGDPDIWLFSEAGDFQGIAQALGSTDMLSAVSLPAGAYLIDVLAFEGSGDITSLTLDLEFAAP